MSKGRESLAFVANAPVVLFIEQTVEFLLCAGQALTVAPWCPCFQGERVELRMQMLGPRNF